MSNVKSMTIHDCARVEVEVDHANGCVQVICYGPTPKTSFSEFTLTLFGLEDCPPELMPVTYIDPPQDEDQDEDEQEVEYADKHGV